MARTKPVADENDRAQIARDTELSAREQRLARRRSRNRRSYRQSLARMSAEEQAAHRKKKAAQVMARYHSLTPEEKKERNRLAYMKVKKRASESTPEAKKKAAAKRREIFRRWYYKNHATNVQRQKERRAELPESKKNRQREKARRRAAEDRAKRTEKEWKAVIRYQTEYNRRRAKSDPAFKMMQAIRTRINVAIRRRAVSKPNLRTECLLGCTWKQFTRHIESLFEPGMTWENWGRKTWHIDHVVPLAAFDLSDPKECAVASNFRNHRPLWADRNASKAAAMPRREDVAPALRRLVMALDPDFFRRETRRRKPRGEK